MCNTGFTLEAIQIEKIRKLIELHMIEKLRIKKNHLVGYVPTFMTEGNFSSAVTLINQGCNLGRRNKKDLQAIWHTEYSKEIYLEALKCIAGIKDEGEKQELYFCLGTHPIILTLNAYDLGDSTFYNKWCEYLREKGINLVVLEQNIASYKESNHKEEVIQQRRKVLTFTSEERLKLKAEGKLIQSIEDRMKKLMEQQEEEAIPLIEFQEEGPWHSSLSVRGEHTLNQLIQLLAQEERLDIISSYPQSFLKNSPLFFENYQWPITKEIEKKNIDAFMHTYRISINSDTRDWLRLVRNLAGMWNRDYKIEVQTIIEAIYQQGCTYALEEYEDTYCTEETENRTRADYVFLASLYARVDAASDYIRCIKRYKENGDAPAIKEEYEMLLKQLPASYYKDLEEEIINDLLGIEVCAENMDISVLEAYFEKVIFDYSVLNTIFKVYVNKLIVAYKDGKKEYAEKLLALQPFMSGEIPFPTELLEQYSPSDFDKWEHLIIDEDDKEEVMIWLKKVSKGKISESDFMHKVRELIEN